MFEFRKHSTYKIMCFTQLSTVSSLLFSFFMRCELLVKTKGIVGETIGKVVSSEIEWKKESEHLHLNPMSIFTHYKTTIFVPNMCFLVTYMHKIVIFVRPAPYIWLDLVLSRRIISCLLKLWHFTFIVQLLGQPA